MESGRLCLAQQNDGHLTTLAAGRAAGQSGISVLGLRFRDGAHFCAKLHQHLVCFPLSTAQIECRIGARSLRYEAPAGSLMISPAGIDFAVIADQGFDALFVAIDQNRFALAAADRSTPERQIAGGLSGRDPMLFDVARTLMSECANGYPEGALFWHEIASRLIEGLLARHSHRCQKQARGRLSNESFRRIRQHITAHLNDKIGVAELATLAEHSPFHFTRLFAATVGLTPHRYVVHRRLQRAVALIREGHVSMVEIAARTGFADQSHLSRWIRRSYGISPSQINRPRASRCGRQGSRPRGQIPDVIPTELQ
jgi:AraC family transcriptional regulator